MCHIEFIYKAKKINSGNFNVYILPKVHNKDRTINEPCIEHEINLKHIKHFV